MTWHKSSISFLLNHMFRKGAVEQAFTRCQYHGLVLLAAICTCATDSPLSWQKQRITLQDTGQCPGKWQQFSKSFSVHQHALCTHPATACKPNLFVGRAQSITHPIPSQQDDVSLLQTKEHHCDVTAYAAKNPTFSATVTQQ